MTATAGTDPAQHGDEQRRKALVRIGSVSAIVGTIGYLALFLIHGDLPDQSTETALSWVAARPLSMLHLGIILCSLLWVAALMGLASSLTEPIAWALGRLGSVSVIIGATLLAVHYRIDGPALEEVADAWSRATGTDKQALLDRGEMVLLMTGGGFPLYVALLLGLPFLLFGLAVALDSSYPSWLGWLAALAGAGAFVVGTANFARLDFLPIQVFVAFVFLLDLWMLIMGALMWRHTQIRAREPAAEDTTRAPSDR
jgi:hypothetical protein